MLWIVGLDACDSKPLKRTLERDGWTVELCEELSVWANEAVGKEGLVLLDCACLAALKPRTLSALKARLPGTIIVVVSSANLLNSEVIELLESGADDYFSTAIDHRLMLAKLHAHLRRMLPTMARKRDVVLSSDGGVRLDRACRAVSTRAPGGSWERLNLTPTEFHILGLLLERAGAALGRNLILESFKGGLGERVLPGTVDKHVEALRRKMGRYGASIRTVYGVGYVWRDEVKT